VRAVKCQFWLSLADATFEACWPSQPSATEAWERRIHPDFGVFLTRLIVLEAQLRVGKPRERVLKMDWLP
jgi:hypothetical protein